MGNQQQQQQQKRNLPDSISGPGLNFEEFLQDIVDKKNRRILTRDKRFSSQCNNITSSWQSKGGNASARDCLLNPCCTSSSKRNKQQKSWKEVLSEKCKELIKNEFPVEHTWAKHVLNLKTQFPTSANESFQIDSNRHNSNNIANKNNNNADSTIKKQQEKSLQPQPLQTGTPQQSKQSFLSLSYKSLTSTSPRIIGHRNSQIGLPESVLFMFNASNISSISNSKANSHHKDKSDALNKHPYQNDKQLNLNQNKPIINNSNNTMVKGKRKVYYMNNTFLLTESQLRAQQQQLHLSQMETQSTNQNMVDLRVSSSIAIDSSTYHNQVSPNQQLSQQQQSPHINYQNQNYNQQFQHSNTFGYDQYGTFMASTLTQPQSLQQQQHGLNEQHQQLLVALISEGMEEYKTVTSLIESHILTKHTSPLFQIRKTFLLAFLREYQRFADMQVIGLKQHDQFFDQIMELMRDDINEFVDVFTEVLIAFYDLDQFAYQAYIHYKQQHQECCGKKRELKKWTMFTLSNLRNFVLCLLFDDTRLYELIFGVELKIDLKEQNNNTLRPSTLSLLYNRLSAEEKSKVTPEFFRVEPKYCLIPMTRPPSKDGVKRTLFIEQHNMHQNKVKSDSQFISDDCSPVHNRSLSVSATPKPKKIDAQAHLLMKEEDIAQDLDINELNELNIIISGIQPSKTTTRHKAKSEHQKSKQLSPENNLGNLSFGQQQQPNQNNDAAALKAKSKEDKFQTQMQNAIYYQNPNETSNPSSSIKLQSYSASQQPYENVINNLKQIEKCKSPIHKLKVIMNLGPQIYAAIDAFYDGDENESDRIINNDDLIAIFQYLIAKSGVIQLTAHLRFVETFVSLEDLKFCKDFSYSFLTFQSCVDSFHHFDQPPQDTCYHRQQSLSNI